MIKAIQTKYDGYFFRSRIEARWAVFFNFLKEKYIYEPEGFDLKDGGYYLPDFWLSRLNIWCEVKGGEPSQLELERAAQLAEGLKKNVILLFGGIGEKVDNYLAFPDFGMYYICGDWKESLKRIWFLRHWANPEHGILSFLRDREQEHEGAWHVPSDLSSMENIKQAIAIDKTYYRGEYNKEHHAYTHNDLYIVKRDIAWDIDDSGKLEVSFQNGMRIHNSSDTLSLAYEAARSARFEHGESPND